MPEVAKLGPLSLRRMRLRRSDGAVYLDRWGVETRIGGFYLHRMDAPDPGRDLHDHPWSFVSIILAGGYTEERELCRVAPYTALIEECSRNAGGTGCTRGVVEHRSKWSIRALRLDECHRITRLDGDRCWTLVLRGPRRRPWGFYTAQGYLPEGHYSRRRDDMWEEATS